LRVPAAVGGELEGWLRAGHKAGCGEGCGVGLLCELGGGGEAGAEPCRRVCSLKSIRG
jgi:hypothetical protein